MGIFSDKSTHNKRHGLFEGIDTIVGQKAKLTGELVSTGPVNIAGNFEGRITSDSEVIIAHGGKVRGEIHAAKVVISGMVEGNVYSSETLEITKTGRVIGELIGGRIIIEEGSSYQGKVSVNPTEKQMKSVDQQPSTVAV
jgi:cytoskeletal protein CcmA (bactofilin family)